MVESNRKRQNETREFWEEAIRLWEESGLSVREFCGREGLGEHSLHSWRKKLRGEDSVPETDARTAVRSGKAATPYHRQRKAKSGDVSSSKETVEFMPVRVVGEEAGNGSSTFPATPATAAPIELVHVSGWCVRIQGGFDAATLDAVLTVLEQRAC